jgi:tetratricopeptide (TPR) repeat protein
MQNGSRLRYAACGSILASVYAFLAKKARARQLTKFAMHACDKANTYFQDSIESARQIGVNATLGRTYHEWSRLYQEKGDSDKAEECFAQAATYFRLCGSDAPPEQIEVDFTIV